MRAANKLKLPRLQDCLENPLVAGVKLDVPEFILAFNAAENFALNLRKHVFPYLFAVVVLPDTNLWIFLLLELNYAAWGEPLSHGIDVWREGGKEGSSQKGLLVSSSERAESEI